jgi:hypothetical protein
MGQTRSVTDEERRREQLAKPGVLKRWWRILWGMRPVFLAGLGLIAVGSVCLYFSEAHMHGWWQGTLAAFGVGFAVGGLVDVLAISLLDQFSTVEHARQETSRRSVEIRESLMPPAAQAEAAQNLLARYKPNQFYPDVLDGLQDLIKPGAEHRL